jgi:hypothetical protein
MQLTYLSQYFCYDICEVINTQKNIREHKKMMKKLLVLLVTVSMVLSVVGCSPNYDENNALIQSKMDEVVSLEQEVVAWYSDNGYLEGDAAIEMQPIVDQLNQQVEDVKGVQKDMLDSGGYSDEQTTKTMEGLDTMITTYKDLIASFSEDGVNVPRLSAKYNELLDILIEVTSLAEANGWINDEAFVTEYNAASEYTNIVSADLLNPASIDEAYSALLSDSLDEMILFWQDYAVVVSEPYAGN